MTMTDNVERGMALLDEKVPDWIDRVDPEKLHMDEGIGPCGCVLAQLYGDFNKGYDALVGDIEFPDALGFADYPEKYPGLTRIWRQKIRERKNAGV